MSYDPKQYPGICKVQDAPGISSPHKAHLRRVSEAICRRTGLHCSYRKFSGSLFFHAGPEPFGGPLNIPMFKPDGSERRLSDVEVDDAVQFVGFCRIGRKAKDAIAAQNAQLETWEKHDKTEAFLDDRRPSAKDYVAWRDRTRRGVAKVISA